ncbi:hypothetical protein HPB51_008840 [Rhipicephalus microplus]|uniref:Uncharacterized protein n=1 Tax=Rhipicephalus microplus TaxID=6941 RepID=A0A9J6ES12_RHIMP|nr:hypothetical protein HPB51_008840 [Rhipicephalus microplus]
MEVEPYGRLPDSGMTTGVASRKRYSSESGTDSDSTEPYYVSSDESGHDNFNLERNHKGKRRFTRFDVVCTSPPNCANVDCAAVTCNAVNCKCGTYKDACGCCDVCYKVRGRNAMYFG